MELPELPECNLEDFIASAQRPYETIEDGLYLGSDEMAYDVEALTSLGVTHIINLATGVRNAFPERFQYKRIVIDDHPYANIKIHFTETYEFIASAKDSGKVFVHCNAGVSRSPTVVVAYLMRHYQWSLKDALNFVRSKRLVVRPNVGFMYQLLDFERELFGLPVRGADRPDDGSSGAEAVVAPCRRPAFLRRLLPPPPALGLAFDSTKTTKAANIDITTDSQNSPDDHWKETEVVDSRLPALHEDDATALAAVANASSALANAALQNLSSQLASSESSDRGTPV